MRLRPVLVVTTSVVVVGVVVAVLVRQPNATGVRAAQQAIGADRRFDSNEHAAQAMYDASRHLLDAAVACRAHRGDEAQCNPLFEGAAVGQATTATIAHCRLPSVFATHQAWISYIAALRRFEDHRGPAPVPPDPPRC